MEFTVLQLPGFCSCVPFCWHLRDHLTPTWSRSIIMQKAAVSRVADASLLKRRYKWWEENIYGYKLSLIPLYRSSYFPAVPLRERFSKFSINKKDIIWRPQLGVLPCFQSAVFSLLVSTKFQQSFQLLKAYISQPADNLIEWKTSAGFGTQLSNKTIPINPKLTFELQQTCCRKKFLDVFHCN